jgi:hypothetical protein
MATSEGPPKPKLRERLRIWRERRNQRDAERARVRYEHNVANSAWDHGPRLGGRAKSGRGVDGGTGGH